MRTQLMWSTQALAQPAMVQLSVFPDYVCKSEELALDFDNWCEAVVSNEVAELSEPQRLVLIDMKTKLAAMSGPKPCWTDDALRLNVAWEEVRQLANAILLAFGWPVGIPPTDRSHYVQAVPTSR